jgi:hypothetical protein
MNPAVQDALTSLASRIEAITRRIRTLGLSRAAEDLAKVSTELRRLACASTAAIVDPLPVDPIH